MKTIRQFGTLLGALMLGLAVFSSGAQAQTTESFTATVEVSSTLSLSEVTPLDFGQVVMVTDTVETPTATLSANGTFTDNSIGSSGIVQLGTPSAGAYTIATGAATFSNITITFPATATLSNGLAPPGNGTFIVDTFTVGTLVAGSYAGATANVAACNGVIAAAGGDCEFLTNGSGEITVPLGATISADAPDSTFIDGTYSGQFDLTASFN